MDDWLYLHKLRHRELVREAEDARTRRAQRTSPRRRTTYRRGAVRQGP